MTKLPIALQAYSVREDMEQDFLGTLKKIKAMGYDGVEFAGFHGHSPEAVKAALDQVGLVSRSSHASIDALLADPAGTIRSIKAIGCSWIVITWLPEVLRAAENFPCLTAFIAAIGAEAKRQGMTLLYHNHDFEFEKLGDAYFLDALYAAVSAELLQTELDTCWVSVGGENPVEYLKKYAGRAPVVHLKDFAGSKQAGDFAFRPVGSGVQDVPALLAAGEAAGAQWFVVEQDEPAFGKTALECAEMSIQYIRNN